jgi:hypothetical protein
MKLALKLQSARHHAVLVLQWMSAVIGFVYGFDFGHQVSGAMLGLVLAINSALFCSIMVGAIDDAIGRLKPAREPGH